MEFLKVDIKVEIATNNLLTQKQEVLKFFLIIPTVWRHGVALRQL